MIRSLCVFVLAAAFGCASSQHPCLAPAPSAPSTAPSAATALAPAPSASASPAPVTATADATAPRDVHVTAVAVQVIPAMHSGSCPVKVELVGTITADGPGMAYYNFQAGAVGPNRDGNIEFEAAGTKTVRSEGQASVTPQVKQIRFLAGMEPRGHQQNAKWIDAPLDIQCREQ